MDRKPILAGPVFLWRDVVGWLCSSGLNPEQARALFNEELIKAMTAKGLKVSQEEVVENQIKPKINLAKVNQGLAGSTPILILRGAGVLQDWRLAANDGKIKGCLSFPDYLLEGNLRKRNLWDIWFDEESFLYNRRFSIEDIGENCDGCEFSKQCKG